MRAFVIDDEFFNQSAIEATPRSSCRPALEKRLDTADIVRDVCIVGISYRLFGHLEFPADLCLAAAGIAARLASEPQFPG